MPLNPVMIAAEAVMTSAIMDKFQDRRKPRTLPTTLFWSVLFLIATEVVLPWVGYMVCCMVGWMVGSAINVSTRW